jgi:hypothetical protein
MSIYDNQAPGGDGGQTATAPAAAKQESEFDTVTSAPGGHKEPILPPELVKKLLGAGAAVALLIFVYVMAISSAASDDSAAADQPSANNVRKFGYKKTACALLSVDQVQRLLDRQNDNARPGQYPLDA